MAIPDPPYLDEIRAVRDSAADYMRDVVKRRPALKSGTIRFHSSVSGGLIDVVGEHNARLVAITSHGGTALGRRFLGGLTENLIEESPVPILVTPPRPKTVAAPLTLPSILVPLGEECSYEALAAAVHLAHAHDATLVLSHILPNRRELDARRREPISSIWEKAHLVVREGLDVRVTFKEGVVIDKIQESAIEQGARLICMTSEGKGAIRRLLQGSISSELARQGPVPVLVGRKETYADFKPDPQIMQQTDESKWESR
jgi:nucleotide-binding universal stress UspA family protein